MDSQVLFSQLRQAILMEFIAQFNGQIDKPAQGKGRPALRVVGSKAAPKANGRRLAKGEKRTEADFEKIKKAVLGALRSGPGRVEPISEATGFPTKELALPIKKLLAEKAIKKTGQKRATVYRLA